VDSSISSDGICLEDDHWSLFMLRSIERLILVFAGVRSDDYCPPNVSLSEQTVRDDIYEKRRVGVDARGREEGREDVGGDVSTVGRWAGGGRSSSWSGSATGPAWESREVPSEVGRRGRGNGLEGNARVGDVDVDGGGDLVGRGEGGRVVDVVRVEGEIGDKVVAQDVLEDTARDGEGRVEEGDDLGSGYESIKSVTDGEQRGWGRTRVA
jgi:hypothetical protein